MKTLYTLLNLVITLVVTTILFILLVVADPIIRLIWFCNGKDLATKVVSKIAFLMQLLFRAWGTRFTYHLGEFPEVARFSKNRPIIFVSGHHSSFDIVLLSNILGSLLKKQKLCFISRSGLDKYIPVISFYLRNYCFTLPRKTSDDGLNRQHKAHTLLTEFAQIQAKSKDAVVIFPEGIKPVHEPEHNARFRRTGLRLLLEQMPDAMLVPVVIKGTRDFYTTGRSLDQLFHQLPNFSTNIQLSILNEIEAETIEDKIDLAELQIAEEYQRLSQRSVIRKPVVQRSLKWIL